MRDRIQENTVMVKHQSKHGMILSSWQKAKIWVIYLRNLTQFLMKKGLIEKNVA
jgi:hypothetical protein